MKSLKKDSAFSYLIVSLLGFVLGFLILHPFSMLIQALTYSEYKEIGLRFIFRIFSPPHLAMAFFFAGLGLLVANIDYFLIHALIKEKEKVKFFERFLPICAYCKKIRDDAGVASEKGSWIEIEEYMSHQTEVDFTHGDLP